MIGKTLGQYEIVDRLGAGGMGDVYVAEDTRLGRKVAVKVLPEEWAADPERRERFEREARAIAALDHPNVVTVYSVEEVDGVHFITMQLVEGKILSRSVPPSGLEIHKFLDLAIPLTDAIAAAHEKGITHRDLKPANILVSNDGRVNVLDFGLAKLSESAFVTEQVTSFPTQHATEQGKIMGTVSYMSPEQAEGRSVDHRSDIFSLGIVLYEMATGEQPFKGDTQVSVIVAVVKEHPQPIAKLNRTQPRHLSRIITRCLEKNRDQRYQSALDLRNDLDALRKEINSGMRVASGFESEDTGGRKSLAVLPLSNVSGDASQDFFCDGMTEALITDLAKIRSLKVTSRSSVMRFQGSQAPMAEIASELGVGAIVEGSVLRAGERVRITAQLIDVATDDHLWAERYERDIKDILAIQSEVAESIAHQVEATLTPQDQERLAQAQEKTVDPEAHESYLKGRFHWNQRSVSALQLGIDYFQEAIAKDPTFADAYVGLADSYNLLGYYSDEPPNDAYPKAKAAVRKVLEIDEEHGAAHATLGYAQLFYDWNWEEADRSFRQALQLNPGYASAHQWHGWYFIVKERFEEAIEAMERAHREDPLSLIINDHLGLSLSLDGQHGAAVDQLQSTVELSGQYPLVHQRLGTVHLRQGDAFRAVEEFGRAVDLSKGRIAAGRLGLAYAVSGQTVEAQNVLRRLEEVGQEKYVSPLEYALIHAGLKNIDDVFESLEGAFTDRTSDLVRLNLYPWPDEVREDPRFDELKERMGLS